MSTKLGKLCEGIIESAWLATVITVPLFFNVYSSRIFEPDKIAILRSLALILLAAWFVKIVDEGGVKWQRSPKGITIWETWKQTPLLLPVLALMIVYGIATIFSVTPRVSLWGSYQRLQGTYTTLSYITIFAGIAAHMRRRDQVQRLITAIVLTSLPVSLYGVLQRYRIDPVPWGGDVSVRITANMGNSIFVAAYYIMVFPLTIGRIAESFLAILNDRGSLIANFARATVYVFIASLQVIALLFSGSRGPLLGWLAGIVFLSLALSLLWRQRWLTISTIATAFAMGTFLLVFNIPGGPLESLRNLPGIGRLGHLVDEESKTSRVRTLIWRGAAQLVLPHKPLEYPDGHLDPFNALRPLIGYGPESMFVAYNPFFPPELTQVEKRGRTPDRSHNETWDTLVTTGLLGLLVYLTWIGSLFYYGLKWLGLIITPNQQRLFLGLYLGGGALGLLAAILWRGLSYLGIGLPLGMIAGVFLYLIAIALSGNYHVVQSESEKLRALILTSILAAILAHIVEIHFGIAIAVTRTYFWTFAALSLVIGYLLPSFEERLHSEGSEPSETLDPEFHQSKKRTAEHGKHKTRKTPDMKTPSSMLAWLPSILIGSCINAMILIPLGFDFITNMNNLTSALNVLWTSLVQLPTAPGTISYGVLTMIGITWLMSGIVLASKEARHTSPQSWWIVLSLTLGISLILAGLYWLWHANQLVSIVTHKVSSISDTLTQLRLFENLLSHYYLFLLMLILAMSVLFVLPTLSQERKISPKGMVIAPIGFAIALYLIWTTNLRVIQADIAYKRGEAYARQGAWQPAIASYQHALALAPYEDYYYLFLGKAYADYGSLLENQAERDILFNQAASLLRQAQTINPLNTDHTANLARLYSAWAENSSDSEAKRQHASLADEYFSRALRLSPRNSTLWLEWALLYIHIIPNPQEAHTRLLKAAELDPTYDRVHAALGDYYAQTALKTQEGQQKQVLTRQAIEEYRLALKFANPSDKQLQYAYMRALAGAYIQLGEPKAAITTLEQAIQLLPENPDRWLIEESIGRLYAQIGERDLAIDYLTRAITNAPADQRERIRALLAQLYAQP